MDSQGVWLFLFLVLTLPTAVASFLWKRGSELHQIFTGWTIGVIVLVWVCAGKVFDAHLGVHWPTVLERFVNVFGLAAIGFFVLGLGGGFLVAQLGQYLSQRTGSGTAKH